MINREINVFDEYGLHVEKTSRGRGGTIYYCREGVYLLKPYPASEKRAEVLWRILKDWEEEGFETDIFCRNKEDRIPVMDGYQNVFVLRKWYDGTESDVMSEAEILSGVEKLVELQDLIRRYEIPQECVFFGPKTTKEQLIKHTRELKYVYNYINGKKHKSELEESLRQVFDRCYNEGKKAIGILEGMNESKCRYQICHKDFTHHNLILTKTGMKIVGFDNMLPDCRVSDFTQYLRKVMEKHDWNKELGGQMVSDYIKKGCLTIEERQDLYARMLYPMRFWKVVNHYSNSRKTGAHLRDREKLENFLQQEESRQQFLVFLHNLIV